MNTTQEVNPAPAPMGTQEEQSRSLVLIAGLFTSALALLGVYLLDARTEDFHIMGWYANYVLPIGAIIVGIAASSGYGLASWFSGIKITRGLLWTVLVLQLAVYFGAQYIEFASLKLVHKDNRPVGFIEYFDFAARSFAWKQKDGSSGEALGVWGYAFRGLEILGFAAGGLIVPAVLRKAPYCQGCRRYMRTRRLAFIPASVPLKKVKKSDAAGLAEHQAQQEQAFETGKRAWETLLEKAEKNHGSEFEKLLVDLRSGRKQTLKLPQKINVQLVSCSQCHSGWLQAILLSGQGREIKQTEFGRMELHPEFVRSRCPSPAAKV
jgi:hypothetical protein